MSSSSGMSSLFTTMAFVVAAASGAAYGIQHEDEVRKVFFAVTGVELAVPAPRASVAGTEDEAERGGSYGDVTLRATHNGHFETTAEINGRDVDVMVDTGATIVALTYEDAERAGIYLKPSDYTHQVSTANGIAKVAPITIGTISIGSITVRNVRGAVAEQGKLGRTLLGMTFLGRLSRVEMLRNDLVLHE
jgi:aspartyl protease family protein